MALTPSAQALAHAAAQQALQKAKTAWIEKIQRIQNAFSPPLRNSELSAGLGLDVPPPGMAGASPVGRWVSVSPRLLRALPDPGEAALLQQILDGELHMALRPGGHRRELLLCTDQDLARLGPAWQLLNMADKPLPERGDWEQGWDLFGGAEPEAAQISAVAGPSKELPFAPPLPLPGFILGCMRLSTQGAPGEDQAVALIQAAAQAGVTLFDSADVYATDEDTLHHNHRLLARALEDFPQAQVLTKVGLARPKGRWVPNGRPERLLTEARRAQETLEVERIALLQLHVVDRRVPFEESLDALAMLVDEGTVARIGPVQRQRRAARPGLRPGAGGQRAGALVPLRAQVGAQRRGGPGRLRARHPGARPTVPWADTSAETKPCPPPFWPWPRSWASPRSAWRSLGCWPWDTAPSWAPRASRACRTRWRPAS